MIKRLFAATIIMAVVAFFYSKYVRNVPVVIPFEVIRHSIFFDVEIQDKSYNFQFDTGAGTSISPKLKEELNLDTTGSHPGIDFYGNTSNINTVTLPELKLSSIKSENMEVGIINPIQSYMVCEKELDGILGLEFFKGKVVKIDLKRKQITIANDISYLDEDFGEPLKMTYLNGIQRPHISINFSDSTTEELVLFDTGAGNDFLRLSHNTLANLIKDSTLNQKSIIDTLRTNQGRGFFGSQKDSINFKVHLPTLNVSNTDFKHLRVDTYEAWDKRSILGAAILAKTVVVLDLVKDEFYVKPYENAVLDYRTPLDFLTQDGKVVLVIDSSNAYNAGVRKGQRLHYIDEIQLDSMTLCEQIDMDWIELYDQKNIQFKFESEDGEVVYDYVASESL